MKSVPSDLYIAQHAKMKPIKTIAKKIGLKEKNLSLYGNYMAKVSLSVMERFKNRKNGK